MSLLNQNIHFHLPKCEVVVPFVFSTNEEIQNFAKFCDAVVQYSECCFEWEEKNTGNIYSMSCDEDDEFILTIYNKTGFSAEWRIDVDKAVQRSFKRAKDVVAKSFPQ
nr:hypothetical protein MarFTME_404 [Marseillevirus futianmevirus]